MSLDTGPCFLLFQHTKFKDKKINQLPHSWLLYQNSLELFVKQSNLNELLIFTFDLES